MNKLAKNRKPTNIEGGKAFECHGSAKVIAHVYYKKTAWKPGLLDIVGGTSLDGISNGANCHGLLFLFEHEDLLDEIVGFSGIKKIVAPGTRFIFQGEIHYETLCFIRNKHPKKRWFCLLETEEEIFQNPKVKVGILITQQRMNKHQPLCRHIPVSSN